MLVKELPNKSLQPNCQAAQFLKLAGPVVFSEHRTAEAGFVNRLNSSVILLALKNYLILDQCLKIQDKNHIKFLAQYLAIILVLS